MAILQQTIPPRNFGALSSFDYVDVASGVGYVNYKGATTQTSLTVNYILTTNSVYSVKTYTQLAASSPPNDLTLNFDTSTFNLPRTAKGVAYLSFARFYTTTEYKYIRSTIQKVAEDGTTTTDLSSTITATNDDVDGAHNVTSGPQQVLIQIPLTQTTIKKGEKLRLKMDLHINTGTGIIEVAHDPQNRDGSSINLTTYPNLTTVMTLFMPFRIDT